LSSKLFSGRKPTRGARQSRKLTTILSRDSWREWQSSSVRRQPREATRFNPLSLPGYPHAADGEQKLHDDQQPKESSLSASPTHSSTSDGIIPCADEARRRRIHSSKFADAWLDSRKGYIAPGTLREYKLNIATFTRAFVVLKWPPVTTWRGNMVHYKVVCRFLGHMPRLNFVSEVIVFSRVLIQWK
jgi:hypothetical protein